MNAAGDECAGIVERLHNEENNAAACRRASVQVIKVVMQIRLLAFASAAEKLGWREQRLECTAKDTPRKVLARVAPDFSVDKMRVSVDCEYCSWDTPLGARAKEVAVVPPVSGG